jgi:di/tricarboxylate transporter
VTPEIALVFLILTLAIILFVTERLRVDVIALLVLGSLVVTGLVTPTQALSGFSNPAVITVWAVFILSGGLSRTGIAHEIGGQVLRLAGHSEARLLIVIMLVSGILSAFMNNIGVAALLLPVILDISRQTQRAPSKLLLPLVYGTLLGGMATLISTPTNILISDALDEANLQPFGLFDYTPAGLIILLAGIMFMVLAGRYLLPTRYPIQALASKVAGEANDKDLYGLEERLALVTLPDDSLLAGRTLAESRIGLALGLNILGIQRAGRKQMVLIPETTLQGGDRLLVLGRLDRLEELSQGPSLVMVDDQVAIEQLLSDHVGVAEFRVAPDYAFVGQTLAQVDMRRQSGLNVLVIRRNGRSYQTDLRDMSLEVGDKVLVQGLRVGLETLSYMPDFRLLDAETAAKYGLQEHLLIVRIPKNSLLDGKSIRESHLGETFGLAALGIIRDGQTHLLPDPETQLMAGDTLIVGGDPDDLVIARGLQELEIKRHLDMSLVELETESVKLVEVVLSPYTTLVNKTLRELQFREKYGLNVLAIWRGGRPYRSNLNDVALRFGDTLLLYGPREKIKLLGPEPDFLVLRGDTQEELRLHKAPLAGLLMIGVIVVVLVGWLPIAIAAIIGATLMIITGCLEMEEAYRFIEWRAVFLIAGMLPLGIAMQETGAARFLAFSMVAAIGELGPLAILAGMFILTALATQFMPNPVVAVLMAPVVLSTTDDLGISPYAFMMGIAFAASSSFLSPVGHPANVLVMGPGGYRFADYVKVGLPLALVLLGVTVLIVPLLWPFQP